MQKTLVVCLDGTWNGPEDAQGESVLESQDMAQELTSSSLTNVLKLYANLAGAALPDTIALKNEDEKILTDAQGNPVQISKYLHGVGDSANPLVKFMGGVFGVGVVARIVRGYTFLSRYYETGDDIHICGFSRGAYTARALAGVIASVGLLDPKTYDPQSKLQAYRLGVAAWAKSKTLQLTGQDQLTSTASEVIDSIERQLASDLGPTSLRPDVPMSSVAVWDTVGSMGIPKYIRGERADILRFTNTSLSAEVTWGFHAMAIDELRTDFPVTPWDPRAGITQRWFVGAHADVGGGYPPSECGLSDLPLSWMMESLAKSGARFANPPLYAANLSQVLTQAVHTPWMSAPFDHLGRTPREIAAGNDIDTSARQRWADDPSYRPTSLSAIWNDNH